METPSFWSKELRNGGSVDWKGSGVGRKGELEKVTPKILCMNQTLGFAPVHVRDPKQHSNNSADWSER